MMRRNQPLLRDASPTHLTDMLACRRSLLAAVIPVLAVGITGSGPALAVLRSAEAAPSASTSFFANFRGLKLQDQDGRRVLPERWAQRLRSN